MEVDHASNAIIDGSEVEGFMPFVLPSSHYYFEPHSEKAYYTLFKPKWDEYHNDVLSHEQWRIAWEVIQEVRSSAVAERNATRRMIEESNRADNLERSQNLRSIIYSSVAPTGFNYKCLI